MFKFTPEEEKVVHDLFVAKMASMPADAWAYWSMDQDGWQTDLEECLSEDRYAEMDEHFDEEGEYPTKHVADFLAQLEIEVYGRIVCE